MFYVEQIFFSSLLQSFACVLIEKSVCAKSTSTLQSLDAQLHTLLLASCTWVRSEESRRIIKFIIDAWVNPDFAASSRSETLSTVLDIIINTQKSRVR